MVKLHNNQVFDNVDLNIYNSTNSFWKEAHLRQRNICPSHENI